MTRKKIKIKKIDNITARQVTFSKRKGGLFKKARELSVLCDVEVGLLVFSATGKLFEFASSSMKDIITRYNLHFNDTNNLDRPSLEQQLENRNSSELIKEFADKTLQLRRMKGEDFQGLNLDDLDQLKKTLEKGLNRVIETKEKRIRNEVVALQRKEVMLAKQNRQLKEKMAMLLCKGKCPVVVESDIGMQEGVSSESINNVCSCNSGLFSDTTETSLRLGLRAFL